MKKQKRNAEINQRKKIEEIELTKKLEEEIENVLNGNQVNFSFNPLDTNIKKNEIVKVTDPSKSKRKSLEEEIVNRPKKTSPKKPKKTKSALIPVKGNQKITNYFQKKNNN